MPVDRGWITADMLVRFTPGVTLEYVAKCYDMIMLRDENQRRLSEPDG